MLPGVTILALIDGVVVVDAWLLLDHFRPGATAGHCAENTTVTADAMTKYVLDNSDENNYQNSRKDLPAQEDIDEEHDGKEDSKGDGEVGEPGGVGTEAPGGPTDRGSHG